jgi:hypothetical protein
MVDLAPKKRSARTRMWLVGTTTLIILSSFCNTPSYLHLSSALIKMTDEISKPDQIRKLPFDSFSDLTFAPLKESATTSHYSSFHCVGTGTMTKNRQSEVDSLMLHRPNYVSRACYYRNLYYRPSDQSFHYFSTKAESNMWNEAKLAGNKSYNELQSRMQVTIANVPDSKTVQVPGTRLEHFNFIPWRPILHQDESPVSNVTMVGTANSHFLLYQPYHGFNLGHLIWDDFLSLFSLLDLFHKSEDPTVQAVPLFVELPNKKKKKNYGGPDNLYRCSPHNFVKWNMCVKMYKRAFPSLMGILPDSCSGDILRTGNWLLGENAIGVWRNDQPQCHNNMNRTNLAPSDYVLLPHVMAGTGRLGQFSCGDDCSIGRGPQFYRFRNYMLRNVLGTKRASELSKRPPVGYITFFISTNSSRPGKVYAFDEEIRLTKEKYGEQAVEVVAMSTMTMAEQVELAANSAVFLTNHEGGGVMSMFLEKGSSVLVFWHDQMRFDHPFYESAGYFRTTYIDIKDRPYINRTMAMIDAEVEKTAIVWPDIVSFANRGT